MSVDRARNAMVYKVNVYCYIYDTGSVYTHQEVFFWKYMQRTLYREHDEQLHDMN